MSIRTGIPHISTMKPDDYSKLTYDGYVRLNCLTEKTDGMMYRMGFDEEGFFTQSSGSGKELMRLPEDYFNRAKRRSIETGKELKLTAPTAFADVHEILQSNKKLQKYLKLYKTPITGEILYIPLAKPSNIDNEVIFIGTSYNKCHMGSKGKFILHKKIGSNYLFDLRPFSTDELNFDDDLIDHQKRIISVGQMNQNEVSIAVDEEVKAMNLSPKWGSGTEGVVVHPDNGSIAPRFKVTSDVFREYRKKVNWK